MKHEVDAPSPAFNTLSKPDIAVRNKFSKIPNSRTLPTFLDIHTDDCTNVVKHLRVTGGYKAFRDDRLARE